MMKYIQTSSYILSRGNAFSYYFCKKKRLNKNRKKRVGERMVKQVSLA